MFEGVDGELEQVPIKGVLNDAVIVFVLANGTGAGGGDGVGVFTAQDGMRLPRSARNDIITVAATLVGQGVLGKSFLATKDKPIGDEG